MDKIQKEQMIKQERGITLIALIITIIVLLILAGVSIAMLTGENGILSRAQSVKYAQSQGELVEKLGLSISESLMDRETKHTLDSVITAAVNSGYIVLNGTVNELVDQKYDDSALELGTTYVDSNCTSVTVLDVETGANVILTEVSAGNITLESGEKIDIANRRSITITLKEAVNGSGGADIYITATLDEEAGKENSKITSIIGPDGKAIENITLKEESNGDYSATAIYTVETNGNFTFKATETFGGTGTETIEVTKTSYEDINVTVAPESSWAESVNVTVEFDSSIDPATQAQISKDGTNWEWATSTTESFTLTSNGTIKARYNVLGKEFGEKVIGINNIDTDNPTAPVFSVSNETGDGFDVTITTPSADEGGISKYEVIVKENGTTVKTVTLQSTELSTTISGLEEDTTYTVEILAYDVLNKTALSEEKTVETTIKILSETENVEIVEDLGNSVVVPAGFGIAKDSGADITEGIVIEDSVGNQFVWIPVGTLNTNEGTKEIKLSRYEFASDGTETEKGLDEVISYHTETTSNTVAKDLSGFITSAETNGGYYIGRYEAGGSKGAVTSKDGETTYVSLTRDTALAQSQAMYTSGKYTSDLVNSLAWDTAIVYIQMFGQTNYSRQGRLSSSELTTGGAEDEQLKINDMAGNVYEWTTEYSSNSSYPCVRRGGGYNNSSFYVAYRINDSTSYTHSYIGFRPLIYVGL